MRRTSLLFFQLVLIGCNGVRADDIQIARQIDQLIEASLAQAETPASLPAADDEFVRRAFLCLTGRIPTIEQTREFVEDTGEKKRARLIDSLLESPHYGEHFANSWHRLLTGREFGMARPPDTRLLHGWLKRTFNENRSWDQTARDILMAEGTHGDEPATIFFTLHGNSRGIPEPNVIATTAGTLFLGLDLECAECHDHPFQNWSQQDFWGMAAFFGRVKDSGNKGGAKRWIKETPLETEVPLPTLAIPAASFMNTGTDVSARLPDADEPDMSGRTSLRQVYAEWMTVPGNPYFARNISNRIWAHCFGRGLLNPLNGFRRLEIRDDAVQSAHPEPTHPRVLKLLTEQLVTSGFDQKVLLRCICLSRTWQRSSRPLPANRTDRELYSHRIPTVLSPEMLVDSLAIAWGGDVLPNVRPKMDFRNPLLPLYSPREEFIRLFRTLPKDADRTDYTHGIPQLLFLMNSPALNAEAPVVSRLIDARMDATHAITELYLTALSREPTDQELTDAIEYAESQATLREGLSGVLWTLLSRSEFIINH